MSYLAGVVQENNLAAEWWVGVSTFVVERGASAARAGYGVTWYRSGSSSSKKMRESRRKRTKSATLA